jgi:hypothetical protein
VTITAQDLELLTANEIARVSDSRVVAHIRGLLVEPHIMLHDWDYGEPGQQYPCWMVLDDPKTGAKIAYCEHGFGPANPWGLVGPVKRPRPAIGMDCAWYTRLLDAYFESFAATELPIWRVFRRESDRTQTPITDEGSWDDTWARVYELRRSDPANAKVYLCDHGIPYRR